VEGGGIKCQKGVNYLKTIFTKWLISSTTFFIFLKKSFFVTFLL